MAVLKEILLILGVLIYCASSIEGGCPSGFSSIGGRCIKVVDTQMNWDDAANECIKLGASLAIVDTSAVIEGLTNFIGSNFKAKCTSTVLASESFWTAGHRKGTSEVFNWKIFRASKFLDEICAYKSVAETNNWAPGEPNNLGGEGCVEFRHYGNKYMFNDLSCSLQNCLLCQVDE